MKIRGVEEAGGWLGHGNLFCLFLYIICINDDQKNVSLVIVRKIETLGKSVNFTIPFCTVKGKSFLFWLPLLNFFARLVVRLIWLDCIGLDD